MKLNPILIAALAGTCGLASSAAHADATSWDPSWAFSGFGTIGYVKTNSDQADFVSPGQAAGASKEGSFNPDSKIGGQINAKANSVFSGTVQALSKYYGDGDGNWRPTVEWAFLKAQVTPELAIRVGSFAHAIAWARHRHDLPEHARHEFDTWYRVVLQRAVAQTFE